MSKIVKVDGKIIKDSRGDDTIEVSVTLDDGKTASASVPQGKSRGSNEAVYAPPADALKNLKELIAPAIVGHDPRSQNDIDETLIELDGMANKSKLGANAILGVSLASARAGALISGVELWRHLRDLYGLPRAESRGQPANKKPKLLMNMINGGLHARNNLRIQEYLFIPETKTAGEALDIGRMFYGGLREYFLKILRDEELPIGDEGGFAPEFSDDLEPFTIMKEIADRDGFSGQYSFGIDAAANAVTSSDEEMAWLYKRMIPEYGLSYIEDPFGEEDFEVFARFTSEIGGKAMVVGDDLTTTNVLRMKKAREAKSINAVLIKPNQIGTLTETLGAIRLAREWNWGVVVSHRSGETDDSFIADLAWAVGADGLKSGAPFPKERLVKYGRLAEIEKSA